MTDKVVWVVAAAVFALKVVVIIEGTVLDTVDESDDNNEVVIDDAGDVDVSVEESEVIIEDEESMVDNIVDINEDEIVVEISDVEMDIEAEVVRVVNRSVVGYMEDEVVESETKVVKNEVDVISVVVNISTVVA